MRFLTADYLYPLNIDPIKKGVLKISNDGKILDILKERKEAPAANLEVFRGILSPGFINAHCHLELSHLKETTPRSKGLLNFILDMKNRHNTSKKDIKHAIKIAEKEMIKNGIVGVGDICNTDDTLSQKRENNLTYYNFVEVFGTQSKDSDKIILKAKKLKDQFRRFAQKATIVPHAPYSVPNKLMQHISNSFDENDELITIHMQETESENQLFKDKKGALFNWLESLNASSEIWLKKSKSIDFFAELDHIKLLLVHNLFTKKEDITLNYYCSCPKANLYIENKLPDYSIFNKDKLCVGTDSLASNNTLSILEELQIIKENSDFDINTLLKIGCKNGAEALGFKNLGTFEKGKKPGVNLISNFNSIKVIA